MKMFIYVINNFLLNGNWREQIKMTDQAV